jgi:hypothetical protein
VGSGHYYVPAMFCPGYGQWSAKLGMADTNAMKRVNYIMTVPHSNGVVMVPKSQLPFGYPPGQKGCSEEPVQKFSYVSSLGPVSDVFAMSDVDNLLWANADWADEATVAVHGSIRNRLYFDWHVKSFKGTNVNSLW